MFVYSLWLPERNDVVDPRQGRLRRLDNDAEVKDVATADPQQWQRPINPRVAASRYAFAGLCRFFTGSTVARRVKVGFKKSLAELRLGFAIEIRPVLLVDVRDLTRAPPVFTAFATFTSCTGLN